jgi:hypothetical protein
MIIFKNLSPVLNIRNRYYRSVKGQNANTNANEKANTIVLGLLLATMFSSSFIKKHINDNSKTDNDKDIN